MVLLGIQFLSSDPTITRPNCALDRRTILCLYVPGFQSQVFKHDKILSEQSKRMIEQKKKNWSALVAESAHSSQNTQFGLVMKLILKKVIGAKFSKLA